jgi:putative membrane protein
MTNGKTKMKPKTFELHDHEVIETAPIFDEVPMPVITVPKSHLRTVFWIVLTGLFSLILTTTLYGYVEDLFKRSTVLGWVGAGLGASLALLTLIFVVKELLSLRQIKRLGNWRDLATRIHNHEPNLILEPQIASHFKTSPGIIAYNSATQNAVLSENDKLVLLERHLLTPLDKAALGEVITASKRVSLVTAVSPRAIIDVAVVVYSLIALLKKIALIYGLRPSTLGNIKLLGLAFSHVAVTAGLAIGDTLLSQLLGAGIAARISAKLGEGVVNGLLTARFGLAALAICRPLPFMELEAPKLKDVVSNFAQSKEIL